MRRAPLFRSFSFQASSSSSFSVFYDGTFVAFFLLRVCPCTTRKREFVSSFLLSPKDSHKFIPLSPSLCRERKKDKKRTTTTNTKETKISFFAFVGQTKKRTKKQEGKKDRITPPPQARLYISKKVRYYRHKSSSRSVAGAKTRKRRLFSGGVDFFAGFNRARL